MLMRMILVSASLVLSFVCIFIYWIDWPEVILWHLLDPYLMFI